MILLPDYVINGWYYTGTIGDGPEQAARRLYNLGQEIGPKSNVDPENKKIIQIGLDNLKRTDGKYCF